jgi:hypothetical protein
VTCCEEKGLKSWTYIWSQTSIHSPLLGWKGFLSQDNLRFLFEV